MKILAISGSLRADSYNTALARAAAAEGAAEPPRRMLIIANNLGVLPKYFFPQAPGRDYELSPYLSALAGVRNEFTVFSGLSHPGVTGGHSTDNCFLTAARGAFKSGWPCDPWRPATRWCCSSPPRR